MSSLITPQQITRGWVIEMPLKFAKALDLVEGSFALLNATSGKLAIEYLPPPPQELIDEVDKLGKNSKTLWRR